jgi:hypothetical protein
VTETQHAFLLSAHADTPQLRVTLSLLQRHFPCSRRLVRLDGPDTPPDELAEIKALADRVERAPYNPDKADGLCRSLSALVLTAAEDGVQTASYLHADMVPTDRARFRLFVDRFADSGCPLTYTPMWHTHFVLSFCDLHFRPREVVKLGLFPARTRHLPAGSTEEFNEWRLTRAFDEARPGWRGEAYPLMSVVWPISNQHQKVAHTGKSWFAFHNLTPETSVVHTNDPKFWGNPGEFCKWE